MIETTGWLDVGNEEEAVVGAVVQVQPSPRGVLLQLRLEGGVGVCAELRSRQEVGHLVAALLEAAP